MRDTEAMIRGKVGIDQSLEKDINLEIAKKLARYLEQADVRTILTREEDKGLYSETDTRKKSADMKARCSLIDEADPDLVVSIHQNSYHQEPVIRRTGLLLHWICKRKTAGRGGTKAVRLCSGGSEYQKSQGKQQLLSAASCKMSHCDRGVRISL